MSDARFKTMRHIETVRNYLCLCIRELLDRQIWHDQSKLMEPELSQLQEYLDAMNGTKYATPEYFDKLSKFKNLISTHHKLNSHHPEYYPNGVNDMNLFDVIEMVCDWKSASFRQANNDFFGTLYINKKRYNIDDQLFNIIQNTVKYIEAKDIYHKAEES